jgi:hypothetical protein
MSIQSQQQTDDVIIRAKGGTYTACVGPILRLTGWHGGIWVKYVDPVNNVDDFVVERTDGNGTCGFLAFPSEDYQHPAYGATQNYSSYELRTTQGAASGASTVAIWISDGQFLFKYYETIALSPAGVRDAGPAIYTLNENLFISENGLLCNDPTANLQAAGVLNPCNVGICCAVPANRNNFRLGLNLNWA